MEKNEPKINKSMQKLMDIQDRCLFKMEHVTEGDKDYLALLLLTGKIDAGELALTLFHTEDREDVLRRANNGRDVTRQENINRFTHPKGFYSKESRA